MSLDDGAADGEPNSHPLALGRVEGVEKLVHVLAVETGAGIPYDQTHTIAVVAFRSDQQLPQSIVPRAVQTNPGSASMTRLKSTSVPGPSVTAVFSPTERVPQRSAKHASLSMPMRLSHV